MTSRVKRAIGTTAAALGLAAGAVFGATSPAPRLRSRP